MGRRRILFLVLYLASLALVGRALYWVLRLPSLSMDHQIPFLPLGSALLVPLLLSAGSIAFKPVREWLDSWVRQDLNREICRVYLFGHKGSGKTSLIKNIFTAEVLTVQASTEDFDYYQRRMTYDLKGSIQFEVLIGDYKGQNPSMVTVDLPKEFAGAPGDRAINVLLFVVDIVPRVRDENGAVLGDEETISWLQTGSDDKIRKRVSEHLDYLTVPMLQIVFSSVYSPQLRSVRLIINKLDLVQKACKRGYLSCPNADDPSDWIRGQFLRIEQDITRACHENNIDDFSVHVISTTQDIGTRAMLGGIWKRYLRSSGVQVS